MVDFRFDKYTIPVEHVIVNELSTGRKHLTHAVWEEGAAEAGSR